jgi:hypothetical protein
LQRLVGGESAAPDLQNAVAAQHGGFERSARMSAFVRLTCPLLPELRISTVPRSA